MKSRFLYSPTPSADTGVRCPACAAATLHLRRLCLQTIFFCSGCRTSYGLEQLSALTDDATFAVLAEAVADRLSDRV